MKFQVCFLIFFACVLLTVAEDTPTASVVLDDLGYAYPEKVCEPSKEFKKDCNVCQCNAEGTQFTCEKKDCAESQKMTQATPESEEKCTPGELFKNKCNECKCPESGLKSEAACTVIGCPEE